MLTKSEHQAEEKCKICGQWIKYFKCSYDGALHYRMRTKEKHTDKAVEYALKCPEDYFTLEKV